jgi:hypothetical protein
MAFAKEDKFGMIALSAATEVSLALDVRYQYKIIHTGADASGNDDAQSALSAWLSTLSSTITANKTVEDEKFELTDGATEYVGPGITTLYIVSTVGADAVLKVVRLGTPSNSY